MKYVCINSLTYLDGWRLAVGMRWECDVETLMIRLDYNLQITIE